MKFQLLLLIFTTISLGCNSGAKTLPPAKEASKTPENKETIEKVDLSRFGMLIKGAHLGGLKVGTQAPLFSGKDQNGEVVELESLLKEGPVVLVFYRGYWCPYCSQHLEEFEQKLAQIQDKGAKVIAITPESAEGIEKTVNQNKLSIPVLWDQSSSIMKDYKVSFGVSLDYQNKVETALEVNIATANGAKSAELPVPATYIIGTDGKITWRHYDPDFTQRASAEDIAAQL